MNQNPATHLSFSHSAMEQKKPVRQRKERKSGRTEVFIDFNDTRNDDFWGMGTDQEASLQDMRDIEYHYTRYAE